MLRTCPPVFPWTRPPGEHAWAATRPGKCVCDFLIFLLKRCILKTKVWSFKLAVFMTTNYFCLKRGRGVSFIPIIL